MIGVGWGGSTGDPYAKPNMATLGLTNVNTDGFYDLTGLTQKSAELVAGQNTVLLICMGQSLIANHCNDSYSPSSALEQQFCVDNGGVYTISSALLGASWLPTSANRASWTARLPGKLITDSYCARAIVANVSIGGSTSTMWTTGNLGNNLLKVLCRRLWSVGLTAANVYKTFIIWHEGESHDVSGDFVSLGAAYAAISQATYTANVQNAVNTIRGYVAPDASQPFATARGIICIASLNGTQDSGVRAAQVAACDGGYFIQGYDFDTNIPNSGGNRYDGVHFATNGCILACNGTAAVIEAH